MEAIKCVEGHNIEDVRVARRIAEEAVAMCPESPMPYVRLGYVFLVEYWTGAGKSPQESLEKGIEMARKAIAMDDSMESVHTLLGNLYALKREYDMAIAEGERALLNISDVYQKLSLLGKKIPKNLFEEERPRTCRFPKSLHPSPGNGSRD